MKRPEWADRNALLQEYYDTEWGFPVRDAAGVYERIVLEGFQAGLSWEVVLRRRPALRAAFADFEPDAVARFTDADVDRLMEDASIVRNRRKIEAAITNARAAVALAEGGVDLAALVWSFRPADPTAGPDREPSQSPESRALATALKQTGFVFVGPVTAYALMEAIGILEHRLDAKPPRRRRARVAAGAE